MPKATTPVSAQPQGRLHRPLEEDLTAAGPLKKSSGKRKSRHTEDDEEKFVDSKASRKILRIGQELAEEERAETSAAKPKANPAFDFDSRFAGLDDEEQEEPFDDEEAWGDEEEIVEEVELAPGDLATYSKFFPTQEDPLLRTGWGGAADEDKQEETQGTNLADLILEKIALHEAQQARANAEGGGQVRLNDRVGPVDDEIEIHPKVVEVYTKYAHYSPQFFFIKV